MLPWQHHQWHRHQKRVCVFAIKRDEKLPSLVQLSSQSIKEKLYENKVEESRPRITPFVPLFP